MRITGLIEYAAIVLGIAGVVAGTVFGLPKGINLGLGVMGVGFALASLEAMLFRTMSMRFSDMGWDDWSGFPAMMVGIIQLIIGAALIGSAYARYAGQWSHAIEFASDHPGLVMVVFGLILLCTGMLIVFIADRYGSTLWFLFVVVPKIAFGATVLLVGLVVIGGGVWQTMQPEKFDQFANRTAASFNLPQPMPLWHRALAKLK